MFVRLVTATVCKRPWYLSRPRLGHQERQTAQSQDELWFDILEDLTGTRLSTQPELPDLPSATHRGKYSERPMSSDRGEAFHGLVAMKGMRNASLE